MNTKHDSHAERPGPPQVDCQTFRDRLPDYLTAQALGHTAAALPPELIEHLGRCRDCAAELHELEQMIGTAYQGLLPAARPYPQADLHFLEPPRTWLSQRPGHIQIQFSGALLAALRQHGTLATRGHLLYSYTPPLDASLDLTLRIEVYAEQARPQMSSVAVDVELSAHDPFEQPSSQVLLSAGELRWQAETDPLGHSLFQNVPLALLDQLRIEVSAPAPS